MSHDRKMEYLLDNRIIYKRDPVFDKPEEENRYYRFYPRGTHECYRLFQSKAKITTYKSLKWHLMVLLYLNPDMDNGRFTKLSKFIADKSNGFTTFGIGEHRLVEMIESVKQLDLDKPPKNKLRKIVFKENCGLDRIEKLKLVGKILGRQKRASESDIYEAMLYMSDVGQKITTSSLAKYLQVTTRTIFRNMNDALRIEKQKLNDETLQHIKLHTLQRRVSRIKN
jgi:hypothetical protein